MQNNNLILYQAPTSEGIDDALTCFTSSISFSFLKTSNQMLEAAR